MSFAKKFTASVPALLLAATLAACSEPTAPSQDASTTPEEITSSEELTVVTHESFVLPEELKEKFASESGYEVTYVAPGDGGELVNQLILTKDSPLGDVVFGIDNTFSSRAVEEGVLAPYEARLPESAAGLGSDSLTPIDLGDVCVNADTAWFEESGLAVPATLDDLARPEYKDLLVVSHPASSTPGLAFLAATVGAKGSDGYLEYWDALVDNGVKVVPGWSDAYYTEFSGADGEGPRPLVLSYSTSPAFTLSEDGSESTTQALLETCFRQVEYAGVIAGARNEKGAREFIDFLLTEEVQASIPENMYMYPVDDSVELPAEWVAFAPLADEPIEVPAEEIAANRDSWIREWTERVIG
ncbi:thiamine ABC transporter substrate-binding protein [Tessaracoccus sp. OS52]|uniref:thiamine ABC transporter substrate-binding protein n=1 Tax=Tessaracoccus sp. OS52 TaxID=2886691 RepID=UPI001D0FE95E|nr:thiamine ABC transporter substrate-binding protein [Tessaracoccus sp. OS52]MCC2594661.1 thiamine ABC transporter substrate-binding protein [Tessaracoccus sp. OS52]